MTMSSQKNTANSVITTAVPGLTAAGHFIDHPLCSSATTTAAAALAITPVMRRVVNTLATPLPASTTASAFNLCPPPPTLTVAASSDFCGRFPSSRLLPPPPLPTRIADECIQSDDVKNKALLLNE